jgi:hypothetical protein
MWFKKLFIQIFKEIFGKLAYHWLQSQIGFNQEKDKTSPVLHLKRSIKEKITDIEKISHLIQDFGGENINKAFAIFNLFI